VASVEIQGLARAVAVLDCFSVNRPQLGVREIARQLDMPASTVGRILASMNHLGLLHQNPRTKLYRIGSKMMIYSHIYASSFDLRELAMPMLEELLHLTNETTSLYVLEGDKRVCAACIESSETLRVVLRVGEHMPLHAGSAGKALLAFMPAEDADRIISSPLKKMTEGTIIDRDVLRRDLEEIRQKGYSVSHGERFEDVIGVAAPIFDNTGKVIAALNVAGPSQRFTDSNVTEYLPVLVGLADRISQLLGYIKIAQHNE
jgi:DNA-binding IclR family transcriptional regulator